MSDLKWKVLICRNIHHVADLEAKKCEFGDQQINDTNYLTTVEFELKKMDQKRGTYKSILGHIRGKSADQSPVVGRRATVSSEGVSKCTSSVQIML